MHAVGWALRGGALALVVALFVPSPARATGPDVFGASSSSIGRGGAVSADVTGSAALFYNAAGLAFGDQPELNIGYLRVLSRLELDMPDGSVEQPIVEPDSMPLGLSVPLGPVAFGVHLSVLPTTLVRVVARRPGAVFMPYYENRSQRLGAFVGVALRPVEWLSIGGALNIFAGLRGTVQATEGPTREVEAIVFEEIPTDVSGHLGLRIEPMPELSFAVAWRQEFALHYETVTQNMVGGVPLDVAIQAQGLQTPHTLTLGAAVRLDELTLTFDTNYRMWSKLRAPFVRVEALVSGVSIDPLPIPSQFRDVWDLRLGGRYRHAASDNVAVLVRAGLWYEPTIVLPQTQRTNLVDGDKLGFGVGAGLDLSEVGGVPLRFDLHLSMAHMFSRMHRKVLTSPQDAGDDPLALTSEDNAGFPEVGGGGQVYTFGFSVTVGLGSSEPEPEAEAEIHEVTP